MKCHITASLLKGENLNEFFPVILLLRKTTEAFFNIKIRLVSKRVSVVKVNR